MPVLIGFDPGRDQSFGALTVVEQQRTPQVHPHEVPPQDRRSLEELLTSPRSTYIVRYLRRFPRDMSHPMMANAVVERLRHPDLPQPVTFLTDASSLGGHVFLDLFRLAKVRPTPVVWTGGLAAHCEQGEWRVPKARMVGSLMLLVETHRLTMSPALPFVEAMLEEMRRYVREQNPVTGHEMFHAPTTGAYDDLISALVMCAWWGERFAGRGVVQIPYRW